MSERGKCIICAVPLVVILGVLLAFASSAAVSHWRMTSSERAQADAATRMSTVEAAIIEQRADLRYLRQAVDEMRADMRKQADR